MMACRRLESESRRQQFLQTPDPTADLLVDAMVKVRAHPSILVWLHDLPGLGIVRWELSLTDSL